MLGLLELDIELCDVILRHIAGFEIQAKTFGLLFEHLIITENNLKVCFVLSH